MQLEGHELDGSALQQARLQQHIVSQVSSSPLVLQGDVPGLARLITQEVGRTLGIERVSAWLFNARKDELECVAMYFASRDAYESGAILSQAMFGDEFQALVNSKYVDASDPYTDPRTRGYIEGYLKPNGITSMLDAVVRIGEELIGLVCFEHVNHPHTWEAAEVVFSSQLGDQMALAVSIQRGLHINEQLRLRDAQLLEINEQLEQRVEERTASLHQARNALMESERLAALGAIVAGVAHELNTPIGNARMVATTIADKVRQFEQAMNSGALTKSLLSSFLQEQRDGAILLDNSLERAATLISSFKNVSADQTSGLIRTFKLHEVVRDNLETMSPAVNRHHCKIVFNNSIVPDITMESCPGALGQVLVNFINNALLHAFEDTEQGQITISAHLISNGELEMVFSDDGHGIPAENLPHIFNPFYTTKLGKGGSGLGLHLVYNIITKTLGGRISASSVPGRGTTFTVQLPLVAVSPVG